MKKVKTEVFTFYFLAKQSIFLFQYRILHTKMFKSNITAYAMLYYAHNVFQVKTKLFFYAYEQK